MDIPKYKIREELFQAERGSDVNFLVKYSEDLERVHMKINDLQSSFFTANDDAVPVLKKETQADGLSSEADLGERVLGFLRNTYVSVDSPTEAVNRLVDLRDRLDALPEMQIVLPFSREDSSEDFYDYLFYLLKELLANKKPYIMERKYDNSLIGGVRIFWTGRYYDLSLRTRLDNYYRKEMPGVLR